MKEHEDYASEIKLLKVKVQDDAAIDEVIGKGKIAELIKLMDSYWMLHEVMWKNIRGPVVYGLLKEIDKITIQEAILDGMNDWLKTEVWVLNDD